MTRLYLSYLWLYFNVNFDRHRYQFEFSRSHEEKGWLLSVVDTNTDKFVKNIFHDKQLEMDGMESFKQIFNYGMQLLEG